MVTINVINLKNFSLFSGNLISDYFEILPEIDQDPFFYQIVTDPMCLSDLEVSSRHIPLLYNNLNFDSF